MVDMPENYGSEEYRKVMNLVYGEATCKMNEIIGREGFYGVIGKRGFEFLAEKLDLNEKSHILDVGCGIGGPARFFAKNYGCKVTGIDISRYNYEKAQEKTKEEGLEHLVDFVHGNGLDIPFPENTFTHAIGCDSWCYFPDKIELYKVVYRVLKAGGTLSFLEGAHETPRHYHFENLSGPNYFESVSGYTSKLEAAGFASVRHYDISNQTSDDIIDHLYLLVTNRDALKEAVGSPTYYKTVEYQAELLGLGSKRVLNPMCFIAQKT